MSEKKFEETERDILIELRSDMRQMKGSMEHFQQSESKQWEKLDVHGEKIEGQERTIGFLSKGFWIVVAGVVTAGSGLVIWVIKSVPR